jgi:hypothetical protein
VSVPFNVLLDNLIDGEIHEVEFDCKVCADHINWKALLMIDQNYLGDHHVLEVVGQYFL